MTPDHSQGRAMKPELMVLEKDNGDQLTAMVGIDNIIQGMKAQ